MVPVAARAFARAISRRHFSVTAAARQARVKPAPVQWFRLVTNQLGTMVYFVPAATALLTWPLWLKSAFDGHI
ncbi:hypothetical protein HJFPF1_03911 [Paramyrothecium foliicola]|nr:hypothetical protein HJFPF1_03911 [Paramyrothecium foliicola]